MLYLSGLGELPGPPFNLLHACRSPDHGKCDVRSALGEDIYDAIITWPHPARERGDSRRWTEWHDRGHLHSSDNIDHI